MTHVNIDVKKLLDIGTSLSAEKDTDKLFHTILNAAMDITVCDGGTLYVLEDNVLKFRVMITKSLNLNKSVDEITLPPVPLKLENACASCAIENKVFNIPDVYNSHDFDFSGPRDYDRMTGYHTSSMLVIPMTDDRGDVIGVMQLINALNQYGEITQFSKNDIPVILSLSSQAAIRLTNLKYSEEIIETMNSFVSVMSSAIDDRTPYNANHTRNMVKYAAAFLAWLDKTDNPLKMDESKKREFLMSVWLHDIGKLLIPLEVMNKDSRLGTHAADLEHRFEIMKLDNRIRFLEGKSTKADFDSYNKDLSDGLNLIREINQNGGRLSNDILSRLKILSQKAWTDDDGNQSPWITNEEYAMLSIKAGTLTEAERKTMQDHVVKTSLLLSKMRFAKDYKDVPDWAGEHHEFLNGSGYPKGLSGNEIPTEVRIITILDIYDALTADDRPYKNAKTPAEAFDILNKMSESGKLDSGILNLFEQSRAWKGIIG